MHVINGMKCLAVLSSDAPASPFLVEKRFETSDARFMLKPAFWRHAPKPKSTLQLSACARADRELEENNHICGLDVAQ